MIKYAAINDLSRIYVSTDAAKLGFKYVAIPDDFESRADEAFDPREMKRLFELGYATGLTRHCLARQTAAAMRIRPQVRKGAELLVIGGKG